MSGWKTSKRRRHRDVDATSARSSSALIGPITLVVGAVVTAFLFFANPALTPFERYHQVNDTVLLIVPLLVILLLLRQNPTEFGLAVGDQKFGYRATAIAILCMVPILWYASSQPTFQNYYGNTLAQKLAVGGYAFSPYFRPPLHLDGLIYYESVMGVYFFCWEFFFRGFLLFGLAKFKLLGEWGAVFAQTLPFTLLHWSLIPAASKPPLEILSALFGGLILGALAVRTKSFFYGFLIHWAIALGLDLFFIVTYLIHHGN
jgi:membrane protease YdiL (CAAX protease family)